MQAFNRSENGFTLIELLIVIFVIAALAAISIRQLSVYQMRAFDARAEHDLRLAVTAQEAYFSENESYVDCSDEDCESMLTDFTLSEGTRISLTSMPDGGFEAEAHHVKGEKTFRFSSYTGVLTAS